MKVWLVWESEPYEDRSLHAIFDSKENAEEFRDQLEEDCEWSSPVFWVQEEEVL